MDAIITYLQGLDPMVLLIMLGFLVFLVVKILDLLGYLPSGMLKRLGVLAGSFVSTEMVDEAEKAYSTVIVLLISVLANEVTNGLKAQIEKRKK